MKEENIINGIRIGMRTLVAYMGDFPRESGNCFSMVTENKSYGIVNFHAENLEELIERKVVKWPIKIIPISEKEALICDERIPNEWYDLENVKQGFITSPAIPLMGQIPKFFKKRRKQMVSSIEVAEACLKSNEQEREPTAFEVSLVTEGEKNQAKRYNQIDEIVSAHKNKDTITLLDLLEHKVCGAKMTLITNSDFSNEFAKIDSLLRKAKESYSKTS